MVAIGKAAAAMCRGAARALGAVDGICVTTAVNAVPDGVDLLIGDHPIPAERSLNAGRRVLDVVESAANRVIALISGGGSALCEHPVEGVTPAFLRATNHTLVASGASIAEINLVRRHLSAIKNGGLAQIARVPVDTYLISDVCGADPSVIASGPTLYTPPEPERVLSILANHGIEVPPSVRSAITREDPTPPPAGSVHVLADGHTAARGLMQAAAAKGILAESRGDWLEGNAALALHRFIEQAEAGITVAAGEPEVAVTGNGRGGRNTHAALLAARQIAGTDAIFAAFATDGMDGNSNSAGAIVDGDTVKRGGDPRGALERSDSATYLENTGDLLNTGPTGTNVSDLWVLWR